MVEELKYLCKNPFVLSACLVAALIYSNILPVEHSQAFFCLNQRPEVIAGQIASNPSKTETGSFYSMELETLFCSQKLPGIQRDEVSGKNAALEIQSQCRGRIKILVPAQTVEALYPGKLYSSVSSSARKGIVFEKGTAVELEGRWNSQGNQFICSSSREMDFKELKALGFSGQQWIYRLQKFRARLRLAFKRLLYGWGAPGSLILSLLCGAREYLPEATKAGFKKAGLSHILALSGMHLGFFSGLASRIFSFIFGKKHQDIPVLLAIVIFIFFAGLTPSLLRALICTLLAMVAKRLFICSTDQFSMLCTSFLIQAMIFPYQTKNAAFMLSYGALAGIFLFSPYLTDFLIGFLPQSLASGLSASISAQAFTFPISAVLFGEIMPVGIAATLAVSPLTSIFMSLSLAAVVFSLCMPFLSGAFGYIMALAYAPIEFFVSLFSEVPSITFR